MKQSFWGLPILEMPEHSFTTALVHTSGFCCFSQRSAKPSHSDMFRICWKTCCMFLNNLVDCLLAVIETSAGRFSHWECQCLMQLLTQGVSFFPKNRPHLCSVYWASPARSTENTQMQSCDSLVASNAAF